ncbi:MAG: cadherin-like domain-containing protein [Candidatus Marinimicrobia bacterium]|nr:cadherin-like domain-containing protein [Candidatus Neomarinimicrobiota bacterium]
MRKLIIITFTILLVFGTTAFADTSDATISITITNNDVDWCNFQYPDTGSFYTGEEFIAYAQVYESGVTEAAGQGVDIYAWIGYSETNDDPSGAGWTWVAATYNVDSGDNDEYKVDLGNEISSGGTYYVASRFSRDNSTYKYGGYESSGGGFWDGSTNVSAEYTVTVNTAPVLAAIGNQELTEDTSLFVELSATDAENHVDSLVFSVSGGSASTVLASVSNDTLFLTPADDYFTTEALAITITVVDNHGGSDTEIIEVSVTNVNDAPVIASISDQSGDEGTEMTFDLTATDVDNNTLTWSSANLPSGSSFTDNTDGTATFTWTPDYTQAGTYTDVQFIVDDGQGGRSIMRVSTGR